MADTDEKKEETPAPEEEKKEPPKEEDQIGTIMRETGASHGEAKAALEKTDEMYKAIRFLKRTGEYSGDSEGKKDNEEDKKDKGSGEGGGAPTGGAPLATTGGPGGGGSGVGERLRGWGTSAGGALSRGGGLAVAGAGVVGGAVGGAIGGAMGSAGQGAQTLGQHMKENTFFLFVLFISLLDAFNNMSRGGNTVNLNLFLLICIGVLLVSSFIMPTKMLWAIIGLIVTGIVMNYLGYLSYAVPTIAANFFFFFAYLVLFMWAWMGPFKAEGGTMFSKDNLKIFVLCLGLSALGYFMPVIRNTWLPPSAVLDGFIIVAPPWLVYMLLFKADTQLIKVLGGMYIIFWVGIFLLKSGIAQAAVFEAAKAAEEGRGEVDTKKGLNALVDDLRDQITKTQKELRGEDIHGEVNEETRNIFVGVELQDPLLPNRLKFDYAEDTTIRVSAGIHSYGYKNEVPVTLDCYGVSIDKYKPSSDFIDLTPFSIASVSPQGFSENIIIPEEVTCRYTAATSKNQIVVIQATAANFLTTSYIENFFIDRTNFRNRLSKYAMDNKRPLDTVASVRAAIGAIPEYQGLPSTVYSFSDNGPAMFKMATSDFPLIGIDETEGGSIILRSAIENHLATSGPASNLNGRIEKLNSVTMIMPEGFTISSTECPGWTQNGNTISLNEEELTKITTKLHKLKKNEQERLPDCKLTLTDRNIILLKTDRPNPATFNGAVTYDYTVQRFFTVISTNPTAGSEAANLSQITGGPITGEETSSTAPIPTPGSNTTESSTNTTA
ncbi:MAG: hypothetical protein KJ574_03165 [Nanoarchaeota archaeon]|nr:hypothetical protein [Nanoarchaeota archaeon]